VSGKRYKNSGRSIIPPHKNNPEASAITQLRAEFHSSSGPLPPPEALARYNDVIPSGAERILAMAERQSVHRESLEAKVVNANVSSQKMGSIFAFVLSLVAIVGGIWLIHEGKSVTGLATIITDLAALATVFVVSRNKQAKERVQKASAIEQRRQR